MRPPASGGYRSRDEDRPRRPARAEPYKDAEGGSGLHPDRDARWTLAADARLDDRETLCDALGVSPRDRAAITDHTLILDAYRRWGRECPNHLLGDYAFVVWDPETRTIFCARDHMGCRPFYYAWTRDRFIFASTIEAVLAAPDVSDEWDERVLASYLTQLDFTTTTRTFFAAVRKLPPGHSLAVETTPTRGCSMRLERYWRPDKGVPKARPAGDDDVAAEFLDLYAKAVQDRLRGGPVGVHLSGGLDSSSVAVLAAKELRRQGRPLPPAFTWLRPLGDEPPSRAHAPAYARIDAVAAREGLQVHHCQVLRPEDYVSLVRRDCTYPELPSLIEERVLSRAAKLGTRVLLSGLGGDEGVSFNGRGYYADLLLRGRWRQLAAECSAQTENPVSFIARIILRIVSPHLPQRLSRGRLLRGRRWFISPEFARRVRPLPNESWLFSEVGVRRTQLRLLQGRTLQGGILQPSIELLASRGAQLGIEYRHPLLDRRLLEFALGLPPTQFRRGRWSRWLMRSALASILPSEIVWNPIKNDPVLHEPQTATEAEALPLIRREVAARIGTLDRGCYVDVPRLLEALDARRFRSRGTPLPAPIRRALHVLDL